MRNPPAKILPRTSDVPAPPISEFVGELTQLRLAHESVVIKDVAVGKRVADVVASPVDKRLGFTVIAMAWGEETPGPFVEIDRHLVSPEFVRHRWVELGQANLA